MEGLLVLAINTHQVVEVPATTVDVGHARQARLHAAMIQHATFRSAVLPRPKR